MASSATEVGAAAPRGRARGRAAALALGALSAVLVACAAKTAGPLLLHPAPPVLEKYALSQGAIVFAGPDFAVSARPWDYRLVAEEFRRSGEPSPFGEDDAAVGRFLFFRLLLENRSTQPLVFNPMRSSLVRPGETPLLPMENSDLYAFAGEEIAAAEARGRTFRRVSFDLTATVRPGQSLERYLVFRSPEEPVNHVVLEIDDLWLGSKSFDLVFGFEAFPGR